MHGGWKEISRHGNRDRDLPEYVSVVKNGWPSVFC